MWELEKVLREERGQCSEVVVRCEIRWLGRCGLHFCSASGRPFSLRSRPLLTAKKLIHSLSFAQCINCTVTILELAKDS